MADNPYNLELYPIITEVNEFEFAFVDSFAFAYTSSNTTLDFTVSRRDWKRIDFGSIAELQPGTTNLEFTFGVDRIIVIPGSGAGINPTGYDLNFSEDNFIADYDYDINIVQAEDTYIYYNRIDEKHFTNGAVADAELTTDRDVLKNDLHVAGVPVGGTVQYQIKNNNLNPVDNDVIDVSEKYTDGKLLFVFDTMPLYTGEFKFNRAYNGANADATLEFSDIEVVTGVESDGNFNLIECTPSANFDLGECGVGYIYGKNLNYDIKLCPAEGNPSVNIDTHDFEFSDDFLGKECDQIELDFYHGAYGQTTFQSNVIFNNVNTYHGAYGDLELVIAQNFSADGYHGSYGGAIFTDNPAVTFESEAYHGSNGEFDLSTIAIFQVDTALHGAYGDTDLTDAPAPELPMDAYHGSNGDFELETLPVFQVGDALHGAYGDTDFTSFPSQVLDGDAYSGSYGEGDIVVYPQFDAEALYGSYGDTDFTTFESEGLGVTEADHGSYGEFDLSTIAAFGGDGYHGIYSELEFATTTTIDGIGYHGAYGDADFTLNPPDELDSEAGHGVYSEFDMALTRALFSRAYHGGVGEADLDDHPAIEVELDTYHGSYVDVELDESEFNTFAYHGATLEDFTLQVTVNFPIEPAEHGAYSEADDLKRAPGLDADAYHGANGVVSNFQVPVGESIVAEGYHGAELTPSLSAIVSATLVPEPINAAHALRDGLGGVGGLNHCPISSDDLDPVHGDRVIRLGFDPLGIEDQLNFSFDDIGDDPWTTCNSGGIEFELGFQTQPRFEFDFYAGEQVKAFFPMELFALVGEDVPDSRLYDYEYHAISVQPIFELEPMEVQVLVEVWDHPDDFVAFAEYYMDVELTLTAFGQFDTGASAEFDLATTEYAWKKAMQPAGAGQYAYFDFEPVEYTRFCKGYIVPNGNSVVFDFGVDTENYGCTIWVGHAGASAVADLAEFWEPGLSIYEGAYARSSLEVQSLWTLLAYGGAHCRAQLYDEPEFEPVAHHGSYSETKFEELPIDGSHGANMFLDGLVIPGPGIQWQTETQCLPNDYKPLTPGGDIDYEALEPDENGVVQYPTVPVEYKEYYFVLDARCITFDLSQSNEES